MWTPLPNTDCVSASIEFSRLVKTHGKTKVLSNLDLIVEPGITLGLVGTNGAGKTTLIKCMLDFCHLDNGKISIFGVPHTQVIARSQLVYLPEHFQAPGYQTGERFLRLMLQLHNQSYERTAALKLFNRLGLEPKALAQRIRTYSKGMAQKLGLVLCLLADRPLMVLDEPMSGLDPRSRIQFKELMSEQKQSGKTLFFSTHMLNDVESLCDQIAILHDGQIHFVGTPEHCCKTYHADSLEAAYMNCIESKPPNSNSTKKQSAKLQSVA